MRRKISKPATGSDNDENRWIITYADLLTLLFAFFVVMYALSTRNEHKYRAFSESAKSAFSTSTKPTTQPTPDVSSSVKPVVLTNKPLQDANAERIDMRVESSSFFETGSAVLTNDAQVVLLKLAAKLKGKPLLVTVEGHTDNIPMIDSIYTSNWELSAARAASVVRYLSDAGLNPKYLTAVGYGDQHPVADNATKEGRLKNRRVVIVISPNQYRTMTVINKDSQPSPPLEQSVKKLQDEVIVTPLDKPKLREITGP